MSLGMHFFKVPETLLISKGYTSPRVDDTDFLGTIIGTEEVGYLNSAWGIHIWLMNNGETTVLLAMIALFGVVVVLDCQSDARPCGTRGGLMGVGVFCVTVLGLTRMVRLFSF